MSHECASWHIYGLTDPQGPKAALLAAIAEELEKDSKAVCLYVRPLNTKGYLWLAAKMLRQRVGRGEWVWYRFNWALGPVIAVSAARVRLFGGKAVLQVPTPVAVARSERAGVTRRRALTKRMFARFTFDVAARSANVIVQHGVAKQLDRIAITQKTVVLGNPIISGSSAPRQRGLRSIGPRNQVVLFGVSSNGHYHGFERLIRGIVAHQQRHHGYPVPIFHVAGPLEAFQSEIAIVRRFPIAQECVRFHGRLSPDAVVAGLQSADIAVGPLAAGPLRGLRSGSPIRHRAYMEAGVPFITDTPDVALGESPVDWVKVVESNDNAVDIVSVFNWYHQLDSQAMCRGMSQVVMENSVENYVNRVRQACTKR